MQIPIPQLRENQPNPCSSQNEVSLNKKDMKSEQFVISRGIAHKLAATILSPNIARGCLLPLQRFLQTQAPPQRLPHFPDPEQILVWPGKCFFAVGKGLGRRIEGLGWCGLGCWLFCFWGKTLNSEPPNSQTLNPKPCSQRDPQQ